MTNESKRDWENFFKPSDFRYGASPDIEQILSEREAAEIANEIIRKELEKTPKVRLRNVWGDMVWEEDKTIGIKDAKTAKLICIKEIKRD